MERKRISLLACVLMAGCVSSSATTTTTTGTQAPAQTWPVLTRRHVDLWLHGYAMLLRDTTTITIFRPGYRAQIQAVKSQQGVSTELDANREQLQARLLLNPSLANGQFAPLYFGSWDQMRQVIQSFIQANGSIAATNDPTLRQYFALLASSFPSGADREWLRLFVESLEDERTKFYGDYWVAQNRAHIGFVRATDSLWQGTYHDKFRSFLNNTAQESGDLILAQTLGGEGRTVNFGSRQNAIAVAMPERDPREALYVFAHESVSSMVNTAVTDNTTPVEQRAGTASGYIAKGAVRGGAMLLQRIAPELVDGYIRYYLALANESTSGDIRSRFTSVFSLPDAIRGAIDRQLEVVLGGL
jgi:hypothetical protein